MKYFVITNVFLLFFLAIHSAQASSEVKNVHIVESEIDYQNNKCTITIDQDINAPDSSPTCSKRDLSWECAQDDYLWNMVVHASKKKLLMDLQYSDKDCSTSPDKNLTLISAW